MSNSILVLPGGVGRAGASAKAAQGTPLWATLSTGPKKAPHVCYYRAWGSYREGGFENYIGNILKKKKLQKIIRGPKSGPKRAKTTL